MHLCRSNIAANDHSYVSPSCSYPLILALRRESLSSSLLLAAVGGAPHLDCCLLLLLILILMQAYVVWEWNWCNVWSCDRFAQFGDLVACVKKDGLVALFEWSTVVDRPPFEVLSKFLVICDTYHILPSDTYIFFVVIVMLLATTTPHFKSLTTPLNIL